MVSLTAPPSPYIDIPAYPISRQPPHQICRNLAATLRGNDLQFTALWRSTVPDNESFHGKAETPPPRTSAAARAAVEPATDIPSGGSRSSERAERLGALEGDHLVESVGTFLAETDRRTDGPLLLNGALDMLAAVLVILPREDVEGAMRCVR